MAKNDLILRVPKGSNLTHVEIDANFDRLMYWSGDWAPGTYTPNEVVRHETALWVCNTTTTGEPWVSTDWTILSRSPTALGQMTAQATPVAFPDLGAAWQPLNVFDASTYTPLNVVVDAVAGTFQLTFDGIYYISVNGSLLHNEVNAGRTFNIRIFNITQGFGGAGIAIFTGRNQGGTNFTFAAHVQAANDNDVFRLEIGNGDAYSACNFDALGWAINRIA